MNNQIRTCLANASQNLVVNNLDTIKKTAFETSAGTDEKQPLINSNNSITNNDKFCKSDDDIFAGLGEENNPNFIHTNTLGELFDKVYEAKKPVVQDLLYQGVYLFVGSPKIGKSFAMLQIAHHISNGIDLWEKKVYKGKVVYLALEDNDARIVSRYYMMFGAPPDKDNIIISTFAHKAGHGLEGQLEYIISKNKDVSLIIIDTLQMVRASSDDKVNYASDYQIIELLKKFADRFKVCLLVVHHTRKQESDDVFDTISGTNGLLGAADGAFVMQQEKRGKNKATISVTGRDQPEQCIQIEKNRNCVWEFVKSDTNLFAKPKDELLDKIVAFVSVGKAWSGTPTDLVKALGIDMKPNALSRSLNALNSRMLTEFGICYKAERKHEGRVITFSLVGKV